MSAVSICQYRLSHVEYDRAAAAGGFEVDARLDLIAGDLHAMTPEGSRHTIDPDLMADCLRRVFGPEFYIRIQHPLAAYHYSAPEPDVGAVTCAMRDYRDAHPTYPTSAVLVAEVSNESLHHDRTVKQYLYAQCGIPAYWLLGLPDARLEVYRDLAAGDYRSVTRHAAGNLVAPLARPYAQIVMMLVCSSTYPSPQRLSLGGRKLRTT